MIILCWGLMKIGSSFFIRVSLGWCGNLICWCCVMCVSCRIVCWLGCVVLVCGVVLCMCLMVVFSRLKCIWCRDCILVLVVM